MTERSATTADGTIAWVFANVRAAEAAATRLRAAGFADVRLSERDGTTAEQHVPETDGLTTSDFAAHLERAGFATGDAAALTEAVANGGSLLTLAAGRYADTALAVMRGETVAARPVTPVSMREPGTGTTTGGADVVTARTVAGPDAVFVPRPAEPLSGAAAAKVARDDTAARPLAAAPASEPGTAGSGLETVSDVIPLREERLDVTTERERGEARIRKETVTEQRTITVPVRREQLVVERDGEETLRIPLSDTDVR